MIARKKLRNEEAPVELTKIMRPVAIVQHQPSVPPGLIAEVLEDSGIAHFVLRAWTNTEWPRPDDLGALIVMGGTMNVDELDAHPFLLRSRALLGDAITCGVPTLGVCLGAQMTARVLDADVTRAKSRNAFFSRLEFTRAGHADPLLEPFSRDVPVLQFHEDTFVVPEAAVLLARSAGSGLPQAFRVGKSNYAVQFHFEVDTEIIKKWIRDIGPEIFADEWGNSEEDLLREAKSFLDQQSSAGKELVQRFLELAADGRRGHSQNR